MIINYNIQEHRFNAQIICQELGGVALLIYKTDKEREDSSPQGCASSKWVGCGLEKGWNELDKGKRRSNFQNFGIHITQTSISLGMCSPTWRGKFQTQKTLRISNIWLVPLARLLAKMICQVTQLFFDNYLFFLIVEFFNISFFWGFCFFRVIINFGVE